jgi:tRNA-dihydrouridine synthase
MKCEAGGGMMKDKKKSLEVIKSIAANIKTPFSLKTRIGLTFDDVQEQFEFLLEASKYVWMITIHGRTYTQSHA